jgi:hypothetical protein
LLVALVAFSTSALEVLWALALAVDLGSASVSDLGAALVAAVVVASVFASMAASTSMLLKFLLLLAKSIDSRIGDALLASAVGFCRKMAVIRASSHDRFVAEVWTSLALTLEGK